MERCEVRDGLRVITFDGDRLGHVTSWRSSAPRWTEMSLYRTEGGSFVLEKVGRSVMCHVPTCKIPPQGWPVAKKPWSVSVGKLPRFQEEHPGDDPDVGYWYCDCVALQAQGRGQVPAADEPAAPRGRRRGGPINR